MCVSEEKCSTTFCFVFLLAKYNLLYLSVVSEEVSDQFRSLATLPPEKAAQRPTYPLSSSLSGPHSRSGRLGDEKQHLALRGIEPRFPSCPARSLVSVPTELHWLWSLCCRGSLLFASRHSGSTTIWPLTLPSVSFIMHCSLFVLPVDNDSIDVLTISKCFLALRISAGSQTSYFFAHFSCFSGCLSDRTFNTTTATCFQISADWIISSTRLHNFYSWYRIVKLRSNPKFNQLLSKICTNLCCKFLY